MPLYLRIFLSISAMSLSALANGGIWLRITDNQGAPVANAVVTASSVKPVSGAGKANPAPVSIEQRGQQFNPRVTVVSRDTPVLFPNRDISQHHVYSFSAAKSFEIDLYRGASPDPVVFDQTGIVALGCNIHDWMLGYVYVTDDPHYGQTDPDGRLQLVVDSDELGRLSIWHPALATDGPKFLEAAALSENEVTEYVLPFSLQASDPLAFEEDPLQSLFETGDTRGKK